MSRRRRRPHFRRYDVVTDASERDIDLVRKQAEQRLLALPNVVGVGIGKSGDEDVVKVFVERKVCLRQLRDLEVIPSSIGGFRIDVEEIGPVEAFEERPSL
jgi:hypothetical protein